MVSDLPQHGQAPNRRPWRYKRGNWLGRRPCLGGDEWCRRTLVLPAYLFGTFVFPLWTCSGCESCAEDGCEIRPNFAQLVWRVVKATGRIVRRHPDALLLAVPARFGLSVRARQTIERYFIEDGDLV